MPIPSNKSYFDSRDAFDKFLERISSEVFLKGELKDKIILLKNIPENEVNFIGESLQQFYERNHLEPNYLICTENIDLDLLDLNKVAKLREELKKVERKLIEKKNINKANRFEIMDI